MLTLINERTFISYSEVITALVNLELKRKNKKSFCSTSAEVLTVGGASPNQRRGSQLRSKSKFMAGNHKVI